ncbi:hypothetical protein RU820_05965 [Acidithiobacillus ferrooxidans]|uniref:Uncharacterized protein n=1 Tax=Acidithiobacillus ferrooxidans (strain ATCC 23270 / DSM 14882 / CIP 104768 / NCIMB 8455) TaxID=243159 RepID=B7J8T2_ACIF2|nr:MULTISPECIES: hypothetical protein [Acidithiobacillus]ACK79572.1 hypothetical protein AFE_1250 [Acidithiobacillus ferrooxidans ATCC 23270]MBN6745548.1 hypothetical protein [Acidithiobacillus sp. MC2.2]MBN6748425.1 hypothetical protein [Acidithiobacillus sp. PG05]
MDETEFYDEVAIRVAVALAQNPDHSTCLISQKASDIAHEMLRNRREHLAPETPVIDSGAEAPA